MKKFPYYKQYDQMDCGPTCLRMVSKYYGRAYTMDTLRQKSGINRKETLEFMKVERFVQNRNRTDNGVY